MTMVLVLTFVIGVVAGLRALTPLAVVAWGVKLNEWPMIGTHPPIPDRIARLQKLGGGF